MSNPEMLQNASADVLTKTCVICRSTARNYNYGVLTCTACKSFFRRSNQGASYKTFRCVNGSTCIIDVDGRKSCAFCRFQRCSQAGMDISKAKSDQERSLLLARKRTKATIPRIQTAVHQDKLEEAVEELYNELMGLTSARLPTIEDKGKFFSMIEIFELDTLRSKFSQSFHHIDISNESFIPENSFFNMSFNVVSTIGQRLCVFANSLSEYTSLSFHDRKQLFRGVFSEMFMLNAVLTFDKDLGIWLAPLFPSSNFYKNMPPFSAVGAIQLFGPELYNEKCTLTTIVQKYHPDEVVVMLMAAILLFTPGRPGLIETNAIQQHQSHYAKLLRKYLVWRFGQSQGREVFNGLAATLKDFRVVGKRVFEAFHGKVFIHPRNKAIQM